MPKPNLFICGFAKSGTTVLYHYLYGHPDVYCNPFIKEPRFFSSHHFENEGANKHFFKNVISNEKSYLNLYKNAGGEKYIADGSVYYSHFDGIAAKIKEFNDESKIILCIRNPIERFNSHYMMHLRSGFGNCTIEEFTDKPFSSEGINLLEVGLYSRHIKEYFDVFGPEKVYIAVFDDLRKDHMSFYSGICRFLGIPYSDVSNKFVNVSGKPKSRIIMYIIKIAKRLVPKWIVAKIKFSLKTKINNILFSSSTLKKEEVPIKVRNKLNDYYRKDIIKTGELINRDLTHWVT